MNTEIMCCNKCKALTEFNIKKVIVRGSEFYFYSHSMAHCDILTRDKRLDTIDHGKRIVKVDEYCLNLK